MAGNPSMLRLAMVCIGACLVAAFYRAGGQQTTTGNQASTQRDFRCRHPADPHRRHYACDDQDFDWDETLAGGWNDVRRVMKRIGITPTASYVSVLQMNVTGGKDQVWDYAGQLSFGASADLRELLKIPGLWAYVGASWGTGSDLAGSLVVLYPLRGSTHPRSTWDKCTCSKSFCSRS